MYAAQSSQLVIVIRKQCGQTSHVLQVHFVVSVVALLILAIAMLVAVVDRHLSPHCKPPDRQFLDPHAHADEVVKKAEHQCDHPDRTKVRPGTPFLKVVERKSDRDAEDEPGEERLANAAEGQKLRKGGVPVQGTGVRYEKEED